VSDPTTEPVLVSATDPPLISGRFRIIGLLGSGGSASVFEAHDFTIDRTIALKVLHPHLSMIQEVRQDFFLEAAVAENVIHPNVAAVLDSGVHGTDSDSVAWIALELAPGISLAERVRLTGALRVDDALTLADAVLAALEAMHARGIVHRDISPSNVVIDFPTSGPLRPTDVRLVDFSLADVIGRSTAASDVVRTEHDRPAGNADSTGNGVRGSVNYMSPEQAMGSPVGERGDLYQAGATLYFALTGLAPYLRNSAEAVMRAHVEAPPPVPSVRAAGVPASVDRIVVTSMRTDENGRYASATQMRRAVRAAITLHPAVGSTRVLGGHPAGNSLEERTKVYRSRPAHMDASQGSRVEPAPETTSEPRFRGPALAIVTAAITLGAALVWILATSIPADPSPSSQRPKASATVSSPPATSVASTPRPAVVSTVVTVPALVSLTLDQARAALVSAGLAAGTVSSVDSPAAAGTVLSAGDGHDSAARGALIDLVVASGSNAVPRVVGLTLSVAVAAITRAGFVPNSSHQTEPDQTRYIVSGSSPGEGVAIKVGSEVRIAAADHGTIAPTSTPIPTPPASPSPSASPTSP
jgi:serine/threonine protein kinase